MSQRLSPPPERCPSPSAVSESLYLGIDVGKQFHVAGFLSTSLLERYRHFETCPNLRFANSRDGFRQLIDRMRTFGPLEHWYVLVERTGHYHKAVVQYLQELDVPIFLIHVQERPSGMVKTDKRDALGLANHLYNQLEKNIQVGQPLQRIRRLVAPTSTAATLASILRHRVELVQETTQRKNKLTAIYDELFPEFTQIFKDPNGATALRIRQRFPTPQAIAAAALADLQQLRTGNLPSAVKLHALQGLARETIGSKDLGRQRGLVLEQTQLITELLLMETHLSGLDDEIRATIAASREGQIILSVPGWGPIQAATLVAAMGHIENFPTAAAFKSYCGWAPKVTQSGTTYDQVRLGRGGVRMVKSMLYLVISHAIQLDCEWKHLYERLVLRKCSFDERTRRYRGKRKIYGHIAGRMLTVIYALLRGDQEVLRATPPGHAPPAPILYDATLHKQHRSGAYRASKSRVQQSPIMQLPAL